MPTYDYRCDKCGNIFELFQSITSEPHATCPKCKGEAKRMISAGAGIIFKGSGFYATDYKKRDRKEKDEKPDTSSCPMSKECKKCRDSKN